MLLIRVFADVTQEEVDLRNWNLTALCLSKLAKGDVLWVGCLSCGQWLSTTDISRWHHGVSKELRFSLHSGYKCCDAWPQCVPGHAVFLKPQVPPTPCFPRAWSHWGAGAYPVSWTVKDSLDALCPLPCWQCASHESWEQGCKCWKGSVADKSLGTHCAGERTLFMSERMEGGVPLSAHPVRGGDSQDKLWSYRDQTDWSKGLWGTTPCIFHLELNTTALADRMVACWPAMKVRRMMLDVNCLSLARMLYRAPASQLICIARAAWMMRSWHFTLKEMTCFYPSK